MPQMQEKLFKDQISINNDKIIIYGKIFSVITMIFIIIILSYSTNYDGFTQDDRINLSRNLFD